MENKTELIKLLKGYSINDPKCELFITEQHYDELADEIVKLFAIPVVSNCSCNKKVECSNCGDMVVMVSSGEFCPHCYC